MVARVNDAHAVHARGNYDAQIQIVMISHHPSDEDAFTGANSLENHEDHDHVEDPVEVVNHVAHAGTSVLASINQKNVKDSQDIQLFFDFDY